MTPSRRLVRLLALLGVLGAIVGAATVSTASASGVSPPVADCSAHGQLTRHYSAAELRSALATMPADIAEYTSCPDVIRRALLATLGSLNGGGSGGGGGGGSFLPGWVIAVLAVLVVAGAAMGAVAVRNRRRAA